DGADLDAERLAAQLGDQVELVDPGGRFDVLIIAQRLQLGPALAHFKGAFEQPAVVLVAVPGQPGAVVEADFEAFAQEIDDGAGQDRVFDRYFALGARADDVDRTRVEAKLFADSAVIDEGSDQYPVRVGGFQQGPTAVAGGQHHGAALANFRGEFGGGIAEV